MNKAPTFQRETVFTAPDRPSAPPAPRRHMPEPPAPRPGLLRSFRFAVEGFGYVVATQRNFRIQLAAAAVASAAGIYFHLTAGEWAAVLLASVLVLVLEMLNTALESSIDLVTRDYHPLAKNAKDIAAAAVLLASLGALGIAALVFTPHITALLH